MVGMDYFVISMDLLFRFGFGIDCTVQYTTNTSPIVSNVVTKHATYFTVFS